MFCLEDCKVEGIIFVYFVCDNINISVRCKYVFGGCVINNGWEIYNVIYVLVVQGVVVLFVFSDLFEVFGVVDWIVVMWEGEIVGELLYEQVDECQVLSFVMFKVSQVVV